MPEEMMGAAPDMPPQAMDPIEQMRLRIGMLEAEREAEKEFAKQQAFMSKYGSKISNNSDLGVMILGELNRRGVDVSAADDAVQQILDQLRMEATQLLDMIQMQKQAIEEQQTQLAAAASEVIDKVNNIDASVQAAVGAMDGSMMTNAMPNPPMDQNPLPPVGGGGDMPPEGMAPPPPEAPAPEAPPPEQPAPPPPEAVPSDTKVKEPAKKQKATGKLMTETEISDARKKHFWQPSASIIQGANRGW